MAQLQRNDNNNNNKLVKPFRFGVNCIGSTLPSNAIKASKGTKHVPAQTKIAHPRESFEHRRLTKEIGIPFKAHWTAKS